MEAEFRAWFSAGLVSWIDPQYLCAEWYCAWFHSKIIPLNGFVAGNFLCAKVARALRMNINLVGILEST